MLRLNHLSGFGKKRPAAGGSYDTDAQAFFTATGISDTTQKNAVDALVVSLKADGIWTKCIAIYPFVGGTSATHAVNLKNPGTYDISWSGTVTHDSNGITGNGTDGYGNTGITPSSHLTLNDTHASLYCRTGGGSTDNMHDFGCIDGSNTWRLSLRFFDSFSSVIYGAAINNSRATAAGFGIQTRRSNIDHEIYWNGTSQTTQTTDNTGSARPGQPLYICCRNVDGTANTFSSRNYAFCSVGSGLTDTEAGNFATRVETFQDALSRGVV
jgi:hypothetical protein